MKKLLLSIMSFAALAISASAAVGDTYVKVTSTDEINTSDTYIIVYQTYGMGAQNGKYRNSVTNGIKYTDDDNTTAELLSADVTEFSFVAGTTDGDYAILLPNNSYLQSTAAKSMAEVSALDENCNINITFSNGTPTLQYTKVGKCYLKYNTSSPRFLTYASGQADVSIFKKSTADATKCTDLILNPAAGAVANGTAVTVSCNTQGATLTYQLNDGDIQTGVELPFTFTVNGETKFEGYASKEGLDDSETTTATYTIAACAPLTFSPASGAVASGTVVTINCATEGAKLYGYFSNDLSVEGAEFPYTFTVTEAISFEGWAEKEGYTSSETAEAAYTVQTGLVTDEITADALNAADAYAEYEYTSDNNNSYKVFCYKQTNGFSMRPKTSSKVGGILAVTAATGKVANVVLNLAANTSSSDKSIYIYGNNEPYTASDVLNSDIAGTQLTTLTQEGNASAGSLQYSVTDEYRYIAIAVNNSMTFSSINISWDTTTGVEGIATDNTDAKVEYYNLQGIRVANPANGIYIRRQGNRATKVLVK